MTRRSRVGACLAAATCAVVAASATPADAAYTYPRPVVLLKVYPDLKQRAINDVGRFTWTRFLRYAHTRWNRTHPHWHYRKQMAQTPEQNRALGRKMAARRGWTGAEWNALDLLWGKRESAWRIVWNQTGSGACHIPQALPCSKIPGGITATPRVAIAWGLDYITGRYGSPSAALAHSRRKGWY